MERKVIALRGIGNVGKSQTIRKVYELLLTKYPDAIIEDSKIRVDIMVVLKINGVKIGITSQGDSNERLANSLKYFLEVDCRIIICATRTYGQTVDAVDNLHKTYKVIWIDQKVEPITSKQESINLEMAKRIIEEVEKAL